MRGFHVGNVVIDPPVILAPMEGVTDRTFRTLIRSLGGCGLAVTEFVSSEGLTREVRDAWRMAELDPSEHPVSIQIYGRDPQRMAQAAKNCEGLGADIVDINLGCPSKTVTSGCAGSALMREPERAAEIFRAVSNAISIPLTVKMRLGWDMKSINAPEIAASAVENGAKMIVVHGRTKACGYRYHSRWEIVRAVKEAVPVPVVVNGDIVDPSTARQALSLSGADGVMVGRGVMSDPWAIRRISADLRGEAFVEPSLEDRRQILHRYMDMLANGGELDKRGLGKLKRVLGYFSKGMYCAAKLRQSLNDLHGLDDARREIDSFFALRKIEEERGSLTGEEAIR